ncbi:MAG: tetratricopeptide repeat protein, partial [Planctomycetales bacterium]|nr:tetratricopeptide repeat protein [Planctomycetales bacterium]
AITLREGQLRLGRPPHVLANLAGTYSNRAKVRFALGKNSDALVDMLAAKELLEELVQGGFEGFEADRAQVVHNMGVAMGGVGNHQQAIEFANEAIAIARRRYSDERRAESDFLACALHFKATQLMFLGRVEDATESYRLAEQEWDRLLERGFPTAQSGRDFTLVEYAGLLRATGNAQAGLDVLDKVSADGQSRVGAMLAKGRCLIGIGKHSDSVELLQNALSNQMPKLLGSHGLSDELLLAEIQVALADILATADSSDVRDGKRALVLAMSAMRLTRGGDFYSKQGLAAAHAELGEFEEATKWQEAALAASSEWTQADAEKRLQSYRLKQPFRRVSSSAGQ